MDSDNFFPLKFRGSQILGLAKLAAQAIETEGVRLREHPANENTNSISWIAEKLTREYIAGSGEPGLIHKLEMLASGTEQVARILIQGTDNKSLNEAFVTLETVGAAFLQIRGGATAAKSKALVSTNGIAKTLVDGEGQSSFPQLLNNAKRFILSGACKSNGEILNGKGFTCTRTGVGAYTIKLTEALSSVGSLYVELNGTFTQVHKTTGPSATEWQIQINGFNFAAAKLEAADEAFSFLILQH